MHLSRRENVVCKTGAALEMKRTYWNGDVKGSPAFLPHHTRLKISNQSF